MLDSRERLLPGSTMLAGEPQNISEPAEDKSLATEGIPETPKLTIPRSTLRESALAMFLLLWGLFTSLFKIHAGNESNKALPLPKLAPRPYGKVSEGLKVRRRPKKRSCSVSLAAMDSSQRLRASTPIRASTTDGPLDSSRCIVDEEAEQMSDDSLVKILKRSKASFFNKNKHLAREQLEQKWLEFISDHFP